ncbi:MAG: hypothetical protein R3Y06_06810 [Faecalibacterium sp.]
MENTTQYVQANSKFDGGLFQLICCNIGGWLLTFLTLGICYPLAICMSYNWEIKHTIIDGRRLYFTGTATGLWGNWIKWMLLTIITCGIYGFWVNIKIKQWKTKHTHFEK